jgi:hypothetical protein
VHTNGRNVIIHCKRSDFVARVKAILETDVGLRGPIVLQHGGETLMDDK